VARRRLDAELVRRHLARSRDHARELIDAGAVTVKGSAATKPASQVEEEDSIAVAESSGDAYVSRGAHKLIGALDEFADLDVRGRDCLDAGASTGGFTQVLLERGASRVLAVDVGYGQLAWSVRTDPRVVVVERTNVRSLTSDQLEFRPSLTVADLSFIPLELVLPALSDVALEPSDMVLMVKPQFEVGRAAVGDGVVRDPALRRDAVLGVAHAGQALGLSVLGVAASPLPGPRGNVEYFLWLHKGVPDMMVPGRSPLAGDLLVLAVEDAVTKGPS